MAQAEIHEVESLEDFTEFAYEQGWTDGLPVVPPTRKAVELALHYLGRNRGEVLGTIFPGDGEATVEKIVANAIMAGCRPEYVPVVLAAVEALVDPSLTITTTQSTGSAAIFAMVSGPLVGALGFHTREWIFGPNGGRANATIGRAIRLILWNIGRAHAGRLVKGTMGHPAAWSYCIGEEQQLSPWPPMHVDYGLAATDSAITVMKAGEHFQLEVPISIVGLNECITLLSRGISRMGVPMGAAKRGYVYVINPSLARAFAEARYTRQKLKSAIAGRTAKYTYDWQTGETPGAAAAFQDPDKKTPSERQIFQSPVTDDEVHVIVGGGEAPLKGQCVLISSLSSAGAPMVTKKIALPANRGG